MYTVSSFNLTFLLIINDYSTLNVYYQTVSTFFNLDCRKGNTISVQANVK